ncbi:hypothetical protein UCD39_10915 [Nitrospirillum sp. BR 11752]|uniref:hypothetical protein n=1 Tax=Nitrospirillum sp. BR 11752 TaxID=3104293 RepID=UPI002E9F150A|nr:hypothetical protein [Nitrospirillum sp. BR 11752]
MRQPPDLDGARAGQRGYALLLTLFLLAIATAVAVTVVGNGLAARKLARSASVALAVEERAALATWQVLDGLAESGKVPSEPQSPPVSVDDRKVDMAILPETGRIDLNGLSRKALAEAIHDLGFSERQAIASADLIATWRGMDPPGSNGKNLRMNGRTALWSLEDLDSIAGLDDGVRACLQVWGTVYVHAQGSFLGRGALQQRGIFSFGSDGGLTVGSMFRIIADDPATGHRFRTVALFRGKVPRAAPEDDPVSPWLVLEWLRPIPDHDRCPAFQGE